MPLVIRELIVRAIVDQGEVQETQTTASASGGRLEGQQKRAMAAEITDQVLRILRAREER